MFSKIINDVHDNLIAKDYPPQGKTSASSYLEIRIASAETTKRINAIKLAIATIIKEIAYNLKPGQDCSQELATRAQKAANGTEDKWIDARMKRL